MKNINRNRQRYKRITGSKIQRKDEVGGER